MTGNLTIGIDVGTKKVKAGLLDQTSGFDAVYEPDRAMKCRYDELFGIYRQAIDANEHLNQAILKISNSNIL